MEKRKKNIITTFDEHLEFKYGKLGTASRNKFEASADAFKIGVLLQQVRKDRNLTQKQLAKRIGIAVDSISKVENNAADIRLATILRIVNGLRGELKLTI